jgi:hypothetical protein
VPAAAPCWLWSEARLRGSAVPSGSLGPRARHAVPLNVGPLMDGNPSLAEVANAIAVLTAAGLIEK